MSWSSEQEEKVLALPMETREEIWDLFLDGNSVGDIAEQLELESDVVFYQVHIGLQNIDKKLTLIKAMEILANEV